MPNPNTSLTLALHDAVHALIAVVAVIKAVSLHPKPELSIQDQVRVDGLLSQMSDVVTALLERYHQLSINGDNDNFFARKLAGDVRTALFMTRCELAPPSRINDAERDAIVAELEGLSEDAENAARVDEMRGKPRL
jgi:hypothetical protein